MGDVFDFSPRIPWMEEDFESGKCQTCGRPLNGRRKYCYKCRKTYSDEVRAFPRYPASTLQEGDEGYDPYDF